jgi:homeobox protein HLX1
MTLYFCLQVKVWFQNRRMKWRHSKEAKQQQTVAVQPADSRGPSSPNAGHVEDVDAAKRRAADSTQLSNELKSDDESDVDIEVDS